MEEVKKENSKTKEFFRALKFLCSEEEPINMPPSFSLNEVGSILRTSAVFSGSISGDLNHI
ncbi:MAG: hypothetical protein IJB98_02280, partial [Clostridia bacterium]|nr:hypothetical protein [Clostridia bacterium]